MFKEQLMNDTPDTIVSSADNDTYSRLFHALIDTLEEPVVLILGHRPLLFNRAFLDFCGVADAKMFFREFGDDLSNRFVPHDAYFHAGKAESRGTWLETFAALPDAERVVSMVNDRAEPHAFNVSVAQPVPEYTILTFTDISQELIKRIMIENDATIEKASGAYNKEYFIHTARSFEDAALFNKLRIGITALELGSVENASDEEARQVAALLKRNIRQTDMLVRWGRYRLLLAYLTDKPENVRVFSDKLRGALQRGLPAVRTRFSATLQQDGEALMSVVERAEKALNESDPGGIEIV